ncbi:hormogonium polysaccharide biosynthesis protein HpsA [Planktothrix agardhii]|uniref:hormogonium polysaccharide biosynthesis protein HpsA n=1 Tax=Planktothrix agardhii TaxID=1160 RepID=UPI0020A7674E|nr:hormogonium polysaccharide biosynthesis protein HpsA [Planktothrix agardhii]
MSRSIRIAFQRMTRRTMRSLLRVWMRINRQDRYGRAGFVLPTVTMVLLVVVLLTITIMLRSMDRAKMAQYRRVDEQVLQAATPALDRAKAKIQELLKDESLPRETPSDDELSRALNDTFYNLGDEQRLQIQYDLNDNSTIDAITTNQKLEDQDAIQTAWRFPVDTNNDGKFDSFTYYGIFFRKPGKDIITGKDRTRNPLDARTPPMPPSSGISKQCQAVIASGGTSGLVDDSGWSRLDGNLKKAFFVYTTTVPITQADMSSGLDATKYSQFQGTPSFSALEYQLDVSRVPLTNNAVVYEDDLIITPGFGLNLNGRIFTNSNLIASPFANDDLKLYQVSGINSCFYREENSKVVVAGNVINGMTDQVNSKSVEVHLYQGAGTNPKETDHKITTTNQSVTSTPTVVNEAMYDDAAYKARLSALIDDLRATPGDKGTDIVATNMPPSIEKVVQKRLTEDTTLIPDTVREEELRAYFKARIRKVTQVEGKTIPAKGAVATGLGTEDLRPKNNDAWMWATNEAGTGSTSGLTFQLDQLQQTEPETQKTNGKENYLGDRVIAGNNWPALKYDSAIDTRWKAAANLPITGQNWTAPNTVPRTRSTQVKPLPNLGDTKRDGYWEKAAAQKPKAPLDAIGGLRVITGAGIYERKNSFLPPPLWDNPTTPAVEGNATYDDPATSEPETFPIVWPDTMPMSPVTGVGGVKVYDNSGSGSWATLPTTLTTVTAPAKTPTIDPTTPQYAKGDLRMRASVVYHYASDPYDPANSDTDQQPIACVSNYYDPTNRITAKNLIDVDGGLGKDTTNGKSNNGVAYPKPKTARPTAASYVAATGLYTVTGAAAELGNQANYVFPDGRFANSALRDALKTLVDGKPLTLANQAAIDSALCSLDILSGGITKSTTVIPNKAIAEVTLLNAREVKANEPDEQATRVDETFTLSSPPADVPTQKAVLNARATLPLEERMPQEVRVTKIDLKELAKKEITQGVTTGPKTSGGKEYLLPFSGIIYASRDDALPDLSAQPSKLDSEADLEESAADLKLDPTRRPNGILLDNGDVLKRPLPASPTVQEVVQDKGLTLVSDLPVYIQGNFNRHTQAEFTGTFKWDFNDYYGRAASALNPNFACHANDPRIQAGSFKCDTGDNWRPANVLADAITLLSDNFRFGYRDEGDFDLRNNAGSALINKNGSWVSAKTARLANGFLNNDYAINGLSSGGLTGRFADTGTNATPTDENYRSTTGTILNSSYFNNFVTPVQRRLNNDPKEFLTEICLKLPVSACDPDDWKVIDKDDPTLRTASELINNASGTDDYSLIDGSGTTATPPDPKYQRFPRRVAFKRDTATATNPYKLILNGDLPIPLGVKDTEIIEATFADTNTTPDTKPNALWFQTRTTDNARSSSGANPLWYYDPTTPATSATFVEPENKQPLLVPILQIHATDSTDTATAFPVGAEVQASSRWVIRAGNTTFNLVMATGDIPARPGDNNGGLQNLPRFLENWQNPERTATIAGAFIQTNRSSYASAPYFSVMDINTTYPYAQRPDGMFGNTGNDASKYNSDAGTGKIGYFLPPTRNWGFDVGLLSQPPDLFAQKFSLADESIAPDEYFREVSRDDDWVKGLLCSKVVVDPAKPNDISTTRAVSPTNQTCSAKYGS